MIKAKTGSCDIVCGMSQLSVMKYLTHELHETMGTLSVYTRINILFTPEEYLPSIPLQLKIHRILVRLFLDF